MRAILYRKVLRLRVKICVLMCNEYFSQRQDTNKLKVVCGNTEANNFVPEMPLEGLSDVSPLDDYQLPGKGTPTEDCGQLRWFGCSDCGHVFQGERQCDKKTCPNCFRRWAFKLGKRAGMRVWAARKLIMGRRKGRLLHIVVSMKYEGGEINEYRRRAYKICEQHQITGGCAVFHHTREHSDSNERIPDGHIHYHIIGLAPRGVLPGTDSGDIFHVIRDSIRGDYKGFQRTREVIACLSYVLTHSGVKEKSHTLTWFGDMSYNKLNNGTLKEEFPEMMDWLGKSGRKCPCCGGQDCHSMWDVEMELRNRARADLDLFPRIAGALESFGVEIT